MIDLQIIFSVFLLLKGSFFLFNASKMNEIILSLQDFKFYGVEYMEALN